MSQFTEEHRARLQTAVTALNKVLSDLSAEFGDSVEIRAHGNFGEGDPSVSVDVRTGLFHIS